jgi:hypothetical protein
LKGDWARSMNHIVNGNKYMTLFYDPKENRVVDLNGEIINDIFRLITPGQLMLFRKNKELYSVRDRSNSFYVCLVYIN